MYYPSIFAAGRQGFHSLGGLERLGFAEGALQVDYLDLMLKWKYPRLHKLILS
jgi:hypothetical protein